MVLKVVKPEIRIIGIDDSPFAKGSKSKVLVTGVVFRAGRWLDGVLSTKVAIDGMDATKKLIEMIKKSKHYRQLQVIMLNGIALAGFNVIDIKLLSEETKLPVIVVIRKKPKMNKIEKALKHFKNGAKKMRIIEKAGNIFSCKVKSKKIYFQFYGVDRKAAEKVIKISSTHSLVPEPIRVAHMIGSGIVLGETRGRV